jgi:hypothetical protein
LQLKESTMVAIFVLFFLHQKGDVGSNLILLKN